MQTQTRRRGRISSWKCPTEDCGGRLDTVRTRHVAQGIERVRVCRACHYWIATTEQRIGGALIK